MRPEQRRAMFARRRQSGSRVRRVGTSNSQVKDFNTWNQFQNKAKGRVNTAFLRGAGVGAAVGAAAAGIPTRSALVGLTGGVFGAGIGGSIGEAWRVHRIRSSPEYGRRRAKLKKAIETYRKRNPRHLVSVRRGQVKVLEVKGGKLQARSNVKE